MIPCHVGRHVGPAESAKRWVVVVNTGLDTIFALDYLRPQHIAWLRDPLVWGRS